MVKREMRTKAEFREMRENAILNRELAELPPSEYAKAIVRERPQTETKLQLRQLAKDMGIAVNELAADLIAARNIEATPVIETTPGNVVSGNEYSPAVETISGNQFQAGYTEMELRARREMVIAYNRLLRSRPVYKFAGELLENIGRERGAVISALPDGTIRVYAVKRAIDEKNAELLLAKALELFESGRARIESAELAISKVPLNSNRGNIPVELQREYNKALDAMRSIRARLDRANERVANSRVATAENMRLELVAEMNAFETPIPEAIAIESYQLPGNIVSRPIRESLRIRAPYSSYSPVEQEIINAETRRENAVIHALIHAYVQAEIAAKAEAKQLADENAKSVRNAEYKLRRAMAQRARRNHK